MMTPNGAKLGLGCVTFGREIDKYSSFLLMDHAFENGIRDFDSAAVYGAGASEEIIGAWLRENPDKRKELRISTKIIPPYHQQQIFNGVEQCLKRLNIDCIDLLYFHRWDEQLLHPEPWLALEELVFQGKIKKIGVSNFSFAQLEQAINLLKVTTPLCISCIQNNHNLAVSELDSDMLNSCKRESIDIITFSPLGAGFLTGKHLNGVAKGSRFDVIPAHQDIYFNAPAQKKLEKLLSISAQHQFTPAFLALAWAIHQKQTAQVLISGRTVEHLDLAFSATQFYDEKLLQLLEN